MSRFPLQYPAAAKPRRLIFIGLLLTSLLLAPAGAALLAGAAPVATVSFIPQWQPQAQFAGFYVAQEKGFYRQRGLNVKILKGGPDWPPSEMLARGRADFGTMQLTGGIIQRARGVNLVDLCQLSQQAALMLVAKKASGINEPEDLNGKKVGLWGEDFRGQLLAFFHKYHLTVKTVPQGTTMNLFLRGGVDAASAMWYNEYHLLLNAGLNPDELTAFFLADHGFNFPEDGLYCLESTYAKKPQVCRAFVQATLEGWRYACAHPEEALNIVMQYVNAAKVSTNRMHQKWMLERMQTMIMPAGEHGSMGILKRRDYDQVAAALEASALIAEVPPYSQFFINCVAPNETPGTGD
jgi:NitT/TauT family transport system substrate-binding protein